MPLLESLARGFSIIFWDAGQSNMFKTHEIQSPTSPPRGVTSRRTVLARSAAGVVAWAGLRGGAEAALKMDANDPRFPLTPGDPPLSFVNEARYLGYRDEDMKKPYAYFKNKVTLPPDRIMKVLRQGMFGPEHNMSVMTVAVLSKMPRVTGEMWDGWFGWHSKETQRYKLWHPNCHQYASWAEDRADDKTMSDRQKYINNISYVDEFVGDSVHGFQGHRFLGIEKRRNSDLRAGWLQ